MAMKHGLWVMLEAGSGAVSYGKEELYGHRELSFVSLVDLWSLRLRSGTFMRPRSMALIE
jgi:hypothetical protein